MHPIQMVDTRRQYLKIKGDVDAAILGVIDSSMFIGGNAVQEFSENLAKYNGSKHVIPCANGTDALQIAMMALGLQPGDEVITPSFTYIATVEVIALLKFSQGGAMHPNKLLAWPFGNCFRNKLKNIFLPVQP